MRILVFTDTTELTPPAFMALGFAHRVKELAHEVVLVGLVRGLALPEVTPLGSEADARGVPFRLVRKWFRFDPGAVGQLDAMIGRLKPDVYQTHSFTDGDLLEPRRRRPIKWQAVVYDRPRTEPGPRSRSWLGAWSRSIRRADQIILASAALEETVRIESDKRERLICLPTSSGARGEAVHESWSRTVLERLVELTAS